jgi:predicted acyltransferase
VGVAIPFAAAGAKRRGMRIGAYRWKAIGRAASLVALGCFVDSSLSRRPVVGLGVLQLIGLAYLAGALLYELPFRWRMIAAAGQLLSHWAALRFVPVPGVGASVFTESDNLIAYLNRLYLQPIALKGLISVVPTAALVLIGTAVGDALRHDSKMGGRTALRLLTAGLGLGLAGWLWSLDLPFSKPLWSAPYILFAAGWGTALLALMFAVIDVHGWRAGAFPLVVFGANAIAAYVLPILVKTYILQEWRWPGTEGVSLQQALLQLCKEQAGRVGGGWLYTFSYILFWWVLLWQLYRKRIFLRV